MSKWACCKGPKTYLFPILTYIYYITLFSHWMKLCKTTSGQFTSRWIRWDNEMISASIIAKCSPNSWLLQKKLHDSAEACCMLRSKQFENHRFFEARVAYWAMWFGFSFGNPPSFLFFGIVWLNIFERISLLESLGDSKIGLQRRRPRSSSLHRGTMGFTVGPPDHPTL